MKFEIRNVLPLPFRICLAFFLVLPSPPANPKIQMVSSAFHSLALALNTHQNINHEKFGLISFLLATISNHC